MPLSPPTPSNPLSVADRKAALRRRLLSARRDSAATGIRSPESWTDAALGLILERTAPGETVAAYLPTADEPPLETALERAAEAGRLLVVPRVAGPHRLEWARWAPGDEVRVSAFGVREPVAPALPPDAFRGAALRLVPALAVGLDRVRLGYGGGFYDAALAGAVEATAVVFSDEVLAAGAVPAEPHDARLPEALTELGLRPLGTGPGPDSVPGVSSRLR